MSQDPLGFDDGDSNLFRYGANNPLNLIGPSGLAIYVVGATCAQKKEWCREAADDARETCIAQGNPVTECDSEHLSRYLDYDDGYEKFQKRAEEQKDSYEKWW